MSQASSRVPPRRWRLAAVIAAMAAFGALLLALAPGTASAGPLGGPPGSSTLSVSGSGPGSGSIRAVQTIYGPNYQSAINCSWNGFASSGLCSESAPFGEPPEPIVVLQAFPQQGSTFVQWQVSPGGNVFGSSCGTQPVCYVQLNGDTQVTAVFNQAPGFPITIVKQGPAAGTQGVAVTSTSVPPQPNQINCGANCTSQSVVYPQNAIVNLTVSAPSSVTWTWGGDASPGCGPNQATCAVTANQARAVTVTFNSATWTLQVTEVGEGGIVSNVQPGIHCGDGGTQCSFQFAVGTQVTLTATPDTGYTFQGYSGACTGQTCTVTGTSGQTIAVTGTFVAAQVQASLDGTRVVQNGPRFARRAIIATISADEEVRVVMRLRRGGVTVASRRIASFEPDTEAVRFPIRNAVPAGRYQLQVTFTNSAGTQLVQTRNVRLPQVRR